MKHLTLLLPLTFLSLAVTAGNTRYRTVADTLYSEALGRKMPFRVCLPEDYSPRRQYQAVYVLDADYMYNVAAQTAMYYAYCEAMPPTIVVAVDYEQEGNRSLIGMDFGDMRLDSLGEGFYRYVNDELVPHIASLYPVGEKNCIVGHSYTSNYLLTYLYRRNPNFYSYLMICGEPALGSYMDAGELQAGAEGRRLALASAEMDANRRIEYADSLCRLFSAPGIRAERTLLEGFGHMDAVAPAIAWGLSRLFSDYLNSDNVEMLIDRYPAASAWEICLMADSLNRVNYGLPYAMNTAVLCNLGIFTAMDDDDTESALKILNKTLAEADEADRDGNFLEIAGGLYNDLEDYAAAEEFYKRSIEKYHSQNQDYRSWNVRRMYAMDLLAAGLGDYGGAWAVLDEMYGVFPDMGRVIDFTKGRVSSMYGYRPEEGIKFFRSALSDERELRRNFLSPDRAYYEMSLCYRSMGERKKAEEMLRKASELNPDEPRYRPQE